MIPLGHAEVHLWLVDVAGGSHMVMLGDLPPEERAKAALFKTTTRREEFVRQRSALRRLLGAYLGHEPSCIRMNRGAAGKPGLADAEPRLTFNISHSGWHTLIGVTCGRGIGVDVQVVKPGTQCVDLARRFFASDEQQYLRGLPAACVERAFFDLWTLKEAWLKGTGAGIPGGLDRFSIDARADPPRLARCADHAQPPAWQLRRVTVAPEACAAIAVEGDAELSLRIARWRPIDAPPSIG